jgi:hypothetical protein
MSWWYAPAMVVAAYLMGSVAFGILVSPLFRLADPRSYGSHNPGATNVLRSGNKAAAVLTLLGDAFKGWLAVYLAQHFASAGGWGEVANIFSLSGRKRGGDSLGGVAGDQCLAGRGGTGDLHHYDGLFPLGFIRFNYCGRVCGVLPLFIIWCRAHVTGRHYHECLVSLSPPCQY